MTGINPFSQSPFVIVLITAVAPELSPVIVSPAVNPLGAISRLLIFWYIIFEPAEVSCTTDFAPELVPTKVSPAVKLPAAAEVTAKVVPEILCEKYARSVPFQ